MPRSIHITGCASALRTYNRGRDELDQNSLIMLWDEHEQKYFLFIGINLAVLVPERSKYFLLSKFMIDNVGVIQWLQINLDYAADFHDTFEAKWQPRRGNFNFISHDFFPEPMLIGYRVNSVGFVTDDDEDNDNNSLSSSRTSMTMRSTSRG